MTRDDATLRQIDAASPQRSTWVAANAGSGKTSVLTDRVARLLLRGSDPAHVLCLTYTKPAASEMQNRLFMQLGKWAMLPDDELRLSLTNLGEGGNLGPDRLADARRLFARAIETPGGLRIQTIHSFCASILRRFPLEAGVSPAFREMDDRTARLMRDDVLQDMADGPDAALVHDLARIAGGRDFDSLLKDIVSTGHTIPPGANAALARENMGLPGDFDLDDLMAEVLLGGEEELIAAMLPVLAASGSNDQKEEKRLSAALRNLRSSMGLGLLEDALLFGATAKSGSFAAKIGAFPTKPLREGALAPLMPALEALMRRVEAARPRRLALEAAETTAVFYRFATAYLRRYGETKARGGWLDFDDLITRTRALLHTPGLAGWVLFRLDGGIEHILVDEAQDTSPAQWQVIEALTEEFTSGQSAHAGQRTLFVVGDKKQSIYSFQGADVAVFDARRESFSKAFLAAEELFESTELLHSFRSSPAILTLTDTVFDDPAFKGAMGDLVRHEAFRDAMPGRVELWPLIEKAPVEKEGDWTDPVDLISPERHDEVLARKIAQHIHDLIASGTRLPDRNGGSRPMGAGDVLILVQRRAELFRALIRACKQMGLPIAGADRLKLMGEMAVRDLIALLRFLSTPEDDLSLAEVLRSPLIGLDEAALYALARARKGYLWEELRGRVVEFPQAALLCDLRDQTDFLRPYDLLERVLIRHDGRRRLVARLGDEAEEGIDALLDQALAYESVDVPSLTGFLVWIDEDEVELKRQADAAGGRLRIMTVHGAKGLEADVVILPDCADRVAGNRAKIIPGETDAPPLWGQTADQSPPAMKAVVAARETRAAEERLRLLYVAMTRARSRLIVAAAGEAAISTPDKPKPLVNLSWYRLVERAMHSLGAKAVPGVGLVHEFGDWPAPEPAELNPRPARDTVPAPLPDWLLQPAPPLPRPPVPLSPSELGGAKALPGDAGQEGEAAKAFGTVLHHLLDRLPGRDMATWSAIATALAGDAAIEALAEARALLTNPALSWLFAPEVLSEVAVSGRIGERQVLGVIDRLILGPDHVGIVDFKTNRVVPSSADQVPEGLLRQMGAYAQIVFDLHPGKRIEAAILWTATGQIMPLPAEMLRTALNRATIP